MRRIISSITVISLFFSLFAFKISYAAVPIFNDDEIFWENSFNATGNLSASSGEKNKKGRFNKLINISGTYVTDPCDETRNAAKLVIDNSTGTKIKTGLASRYNFGAINDDVSVELKIMPASSQSGLCGNFFVSFAGTFLTFTYNESLDIYNFELGEKTYSIPNNKWFKISAVCDLADADTLSDKLAGAVMKINVMGEIYDEENNSYTIVSANKNHPIAYTESTWGSGSPSLFVSYSAPAKSCDVFYIEDFKVHSPGDFQLISMDAQNYEDDENIKLDGTITLGLNHDINPLTFKSDKVRIVNSEGVKADANVIFNPAYPNKIVFDFAESPMSQYTNYKAEIDSDIKDMFGNEIKQESLYFRISTLGQQGATPTPMPVSLPPEGGYIMPDEYNTGYLSNFEDLVEIGEKYPELAGSKKTITKDIAKKYGYVFEGFKFSEGSIQIETDHVTIRDFYIYGNTYGAISCHGKDGLIEDGEIEGTSSNALGGSNYTARRLKIHDVGGDHLKGGDNVTFESCYLYDAGTLSPLAHADGLQISGPACGIRVLGCRIDMPPLPVHHLANACLFLKPDFGDVRNVQASYNWFNGGGFTTYLVTNNYNVTCVTYTDNYIGAGRRYGICNKNVSSDELTYENNIELDKKNLLQAGSVLYTDESGTRINNLSDLSSENLSVSVNFANYTLSEQNFKIEAKIYENGVLKDTLSMNDSINRYIPVSEYLTSDNLAEYTYTYNGEEQTTSTLINLPDLPRNVLKTMDISLTNPQNSKINIDVYSVCGEKETLIRSDEILSYNYADLNVSAQNGKIFASVDGKTASANGEYPVGSNVKLSAEENSGYEFLYWKDGSNIILSEEKEYNFSLGSDTKIEAVFAKADDNYVTFKGIRNEIVAFMKLNDISSPSGGTVFGANFDSWYINGRKYYVGTSIETDKNIIAKAGYSKTSSPITVTVNGEVSSKNYNEQVTVSVSDESFSFWMRDGKIVSYEPQYTFFADHDTTVNAVYNENADSSIIINLSKTDSGRAFAERNIPEKYTVIESGIIAGYGNISLKNYEKKLICISNSNHGQFTAANSAGLNLRAYVIYSDSSGTYISYSEQI